ncbi:MAG: oprP [Myxococcales bacterium]|nr:oprP [Myxococcales bacterium]
MRHFASALIVLVSAAAVAQEQTPATVAAPAVAPPVVPPPEAPALSAAEAGALLRRVDDLEQQHRILARQIERAAEQAAAKSRDAGSVSFGGKGFILRSADGKTQVALRGLLQADGRAFFDDHKFALADTFLLRRVRPILDATFFDLIDFRIMPDFGNNQVILYDAYAELRPWRFFRIRAGKFKPPVGLERLQSAGNLHFNERAFPTSLVPNRDVGVTLNGDVAGGALSYAIGYFNGVVDGAATPDLDVHDGKELAVRLFAHPLRPLRDKLFNNLGVGFAATYGQERGRTAAPNVPSFRTPGQNVFFSYLADPTKPDGVTFADGTRYRLTPQLYWYAWHFGLLAEYVYSSQVVTRGFDNTRPLANQAWQVLLSVVLTPGDRAAFDGVVPTRPIDFKHPQIGAVELVARYHELRVDPAAFPAFADPTKSAEQARAFGVGFNWYLTANARFNLDYDHTEFFHGGAPDGTNGGAPTNRPTEHALIGRFQVAL